MAAALASCYTSPNQSRRHQQGYGCPTAYCIRFLGQMKAVFPSLLGVTSLRLRRHAKGTCDFLIPHLHQWGTSGRYPMPFSAFTGAVTYSSKKIGEPFFKLLSAITSSPRRRAVAPVNTYTALSSRWEVCEPYILRVCSWHFPPDGRDSRPCIQCAYRRLSSQIRSNLLCPTTDTLTAGTLPMGNTSSVIDGEPSHAPRALLLRIWRAVFPAVIGNIPQTHADVQKHL